MNITKTIIAVAALACVGAANAQTNQADSIAVAAATSMSESINRGIEQMQQLGLDFNRDVFIATLNKALQGEDTGISVDAANDYLDECLRSANAVVPKTVSVESQQAFLAETAKQPGAKVLDSGVIFFTIEEGTGAMPTTANKVTVELNSVLSDGSVFYKTEPGEPDEYDVTGVIKGFAEGLQLMRVGGTYRVVIPSNLAYGEKGINGVVPGNAALTFTVHLLSIR